MNIEEILKGTSLKNRNESLLIESRIELSHKKKYIIDSWKSAEKNKICFNKSILHKYSSRVFFKF